jgi:D-3-phosphoglycerate dehydrogenase
MREFASMKPTAFFVNTARGGIHREDELVTALRERLIAGAGLDVFLDEPPPPTHPLLSLPNVIANPHIAGMTAESQTRMSEFAARQWIDIFAGRVPPRLINRQAWPAYSKRFSRVFGFAPAPI